MQFKPLQDRILVERAQEETKTAGGIIIPDNSNEKPLEGKVVAVGAGKMLDSGVLQTLTVNEGDTVLFGNYAGTEIKVDGKDYPVMKEAEVLGTFVQ